MYACLLRTLLIQISKTKLLVEIASESGRFANLTEDYLQEIIDNKDSKQKYLWGIVKQIQHGLFREVVKIPGPSMFDAWGYFPPLRVEKWCHASNTSGPVIFTTSLNTMLHLNIIY